MEAITTGEKLGEQKAQTKKTPKKKTKNSSLLLDSTELVKVAKFCLDDDTEKAEYEKVLNDPALKIFRDEFVFDKLGHSQIVIWYYDMSS